MIVRGRLSSIQFDEADLRILAELVNNSKSSFVEIGQKLLIHPNVVAYRVKRMEQAGIIKRYTTILDLEKLGLNEQIYISASFPDYFLNIEKDDTLKQIAKIPQVVMITTLQGDPSLIIQLAGKSKAEVDMATFKIKKLGIKIENATPITRTHHNWILGDIFETIASTMSTESYRSKAP